MSRSGYSDVEDQWTLIRWRGAVASAIRGRRGQATLREILAALDAMPEKSLVAGSLATPGGEFCTLGALGAARGLDMAAIDPDCREDVAAKFGISEALAAEIMYLNDEHVDDSRWVTVEICGPVRPYYPDYGHHARNVSVADTQAAEKRWAFMRSWVANRLVDLPAAGEGKG